MRRDGRLRQREDHRRPRDRRASALAVPGGRRPAPRGQRREDGARRAAHRRRPLAVAGGGRGAGWTTASRRGSPACSPARRCTAATGTSCGRDGRRSRFCHVAVDADVLRRRVEARHGHYMPPSLLPSQLAALEPLQPDEPGITVPGDGSPTSCWRRPCAGSGWTAGPGSLCAARRPGHRACGRIAQLVERLPYKEDVRGSSPFGRPADAGQTPAAVTIASVRNPASRPIRTPT